MTASASERSSSKSARLAETVDVSGERRVIQAQQRRALVHVTNEAVQNLPISNRNWSSLTALTPGVVGNTRIGSAGTNNNNVMMDGVAIMDTGNNGQMLQTNVDAIAEVKILTSGYQAEYGRVERHADHRGDEERHEPVPRIGVRHRAQLRLEREQLGRIRRTAIRRRCPSSATGATRSVGLSASRAATNKLFFFYAHEYRPRTTGGDIRRFRVPTVLERGGDFSQSTDNNGARCHLYDPRTAPDAVCRAPRRIRAPASRMAACWDGFRRIACIRSVSTS